MPKCSLKNCKNITSRTLKKDGISYFRCRKWIKACQRPDLGNKSYKTLRSQHVCSLHFEKKMYSKVHLKVTAIPTLNLPPPDRSVGTQTDPPEIQMLIDVDPADVQCTATNDENSLELSYVHSPMQTSSKETDHNPLKRRLGNKVMFYKKDLTKITKKQFQAGCDQFLNSKLNNIVKTQMNLKFHTKGKRYSKEFKLFAMNMYYANPTAYRFLTKTLCLPSKNTLSSMYIPMTTQINKQMLDALSTKAKLMSPSQKECVVCMDKMSLKYSLAYDSKQDRIVGLHEIDGQQDPYVAEYAFTIMLQGITSKWKQPIGFAFISSSKIDDKLEHWIINTINKLFEMGFQIRAIVTNQGSDFVKFAKSKGISKDQSHFVINGKRIYYIFDIPHILISIRNNLINNNYEYNGKTVSWDDIQALYNLEVINNMRCVPRLTDAHILPNNFQRQKIRFAAQVFSSSVVAAFETYTSSGQMELNNGTIEFFKTVNDLFDLLNSSDPYSPKPYGKPLRGDNSQIELLNKAENIFMNLIVRDKINGEDVTKTMKFINSILISMNSIRQLLFDMQNENCASHLFTRRLNNDGLENFFGLIRQASGNSCKPTGIQFTRAFRKSYFHQLMQLSDGGNCREDFDSILFKFNDFIKNNSLTVNPNETKANQGNIETLKTPRFELPEANAFLYICGYIWRRCVQKHKCTKMAKYASSYTTEASMENVYLRERAYNKTVDIFGRRQGVPDDFLNFCKELENGLNDSFATFEGDNVGENIYDHLIQIKCSMPCDCFPLEFLIRLYVRMRLHYIVKYNNQKLQSSNNKFRKYLSVQHL